MKKLLVLAAFAALVLGMTGCCSLRTPANSKNKNLNYYCTFFGLSLESAVYGDGFIVNANNSNK